MMHHECPLSPRFQCLPQLGLPTLLVYATSPSPRCPTSSMVVSREGSLSTDLRGTDLDLASTCRKVLPHWSRPNRAATTPKRYPSEHQAPSSDA